MARKDIRKYHSMTHGELVEDMLTKLNAELAERAAKRKALGGKVQFDPVEWLKADLAAHGPARQSDDIPRAPKLDGTTIFAKVKSVIDDPEAGPVGTLRGDRLRTKFDPAKPVVPMKPRQPGVGGKRLDDAAMIARAKQVKASGTARHLGDMMLQAGIGATARYLIANRNAEFRELCSSYRPTPYHFTKYAQLIDNSVIARFAAAVERGEHPHRTADRLIDEKRRDRKTKHRAKVRANKGESLVDIFALQLPRTHTKTGREDLAARARFARNVSILRALVGVANRDGCSIDTAVKRMKLRDGLDLKAAKAEARAVVAWARAQGVIEGARGVASVSDPAATVVTPKADSGCRAEGAWTRERIIEEGRKRRREMERVLAGSSDEGRSFEDIIIEAAAASKRRKARFEKAREKRERGGSLDKV